MRYLTVKLSIETEHYDGVADAHRKALDALIEALDDYPGTIYVSDESMPRAENARGTR